MIRPNGFTLIELLVAMTAGSLLLASMSWIVMRLGKQASEVRSTQQALQLSAALDRVRLLIQDARAGSADRIDLSSRHLTFNTNPPLNLGAIGLVQAELLVVRSPSGEALDLTLRDRDGRDLPDMATTRLLTDQKSVRFSWNGQEHSVIRLDIRDQRDRKSALVVPLVVTGDPTCVFDVISMACR